MPLHTVIKLTPKAYGCEEETFSLPIEAVDTHRPRATRKHRSSNGNTSPVHVLQGPYGNSVGAGPASPNLPAVTIEEGGSAEQLVAPMVVDNHVTGSKIAADAASSTSTASTSITPGAPSSNIIEEQLSVVQIDHDEVLVPRDRIDDHTETLRVTHRLRRSPFAERGGAGGMLRVKQFESAEELVRAGGESEMKVDADNAGAEKDVNLSPGSPLRKLAREANPKE